MKVGRNDPCPCGSGKKYKKCCLARDEAAARQSAQERARVIRAVEPRAGHDPFAGFPAYNGHLALLAETMARGWPLVRESDKYFPGADSARTARAWIATSPRS